MRYSKYNKHDFIYRRSIDCDRPSFWVFDDPEAYNDQFKWMRNLEFTTAAVFSGTNISRLEGGIYVHRGSFAGDRSIEMRFQEFEQFRILSGYNVLPDSIASLCREKGLMVVQGYMSGEKISWVDIFPSKLAWYRVADCPGDGIPLIPIGPHIRFSYRIVKDLCEGNYYLNGRLRHHYYYDGSLGCPIMMSDETRRSIAGIIERDL